MSKKHFAFKIVVNMVTVDMVTVVDMVFQQVGKANKVVSKDVLVLGGQGLSGSASVEALLVAGYKGTFTTLLQRSQPLLGHDEDPAPSRP